MQMWIWHQPFRLRPHQVACHKDLFYLLNRSTIPYSIYYTIFLVLILLLFWVIFSPCDVAESKMVCVHAEICILGTGVMRVVFHNLYYNSDSCLLLCLQYMKFDMTKGASNIVKFY
jgi:hypothetical protein